MENAPRYLILQCQGMMLNMITALQTTEQWTRSLK